MRDLLRAAEPTVERERGRLSREGWGARLLAKQDPAGLDRRAVFGRRPLLAEVDLDHIHDVAAARFRFAAQEPRHASRGWSFPSFRISSMTTPVSMGSLATCSSNRWRMELPALTGRNALSVHTTIGALEGLRNYELHRGRNLRTVRAAQRRGREFLLVHLLFRSHRTGEVIKPVFTQFSFPPRSHYDILRALDYFQTVNAPYDERLAEAIDIVRRSQRADGCWTLQNSYRGKTYFEMEEWARPAVGTLFARCTC